jgi:hypothetical protein
VASGADLLDARCTNHTLILLALKLVFALISYLWDEIRVPPATLRLCLVASITKQDFLILDMLISYKISLDFLTCLVGWVCSNKLD